MILQYGMYGARNRTADKELTIYLCTYILQHGMLMDAPTKNKIIKKQDKTEPFHTANLIRLTWTEPADRYSACEYVCL